MALRFATPTPDDVEYEERFLIKLQDEDRFPTRAKTSECGDKPGSVTVDKATAGVIYLGRQLLAVSSNLPEESFAGRTPAAAGPHLLCLVLLRVGFT